MEEVLAGLRAEHGQTHAIGCDDGRWVAASRDGAGPELRRASAPGLDMALRINRGGSR
jgi:hypothetical protein